MKDEIERYFAQFKQPVQQIIERRPLNLTVDQVMKAIEEVYAKEQNGLKLTNRRRVWYIWELAAKIEPEDPKPQSITEVQKELKRLRAELAASKCNFSNNEIRALAAEFAQFKEAMSVGFRTLADSIKTFVDAASSDMVGIVYKERFIDKVYNWMDFAKNWVW
jgi:uncharacterized coiled-coil DUF342 family protein